MEYNFWKQFEKDIIIHNDKMNIIESCVDRHALQNPNKVALVFQDENGEVLKYSYKDLQIEVNKFANYLESLKVKKNSRIFLFLPKVPEMYTCFLGAIKQGSIAVPLFEAFETDGLELRLNRGDANVLVTNKELLKRLKSKNKFKNMKIVVVDSFDFKNKIKKQSENFGAVLKNKEDTCLMIFTSSTAGTPVAGIEISHYAIVQQHYTAKLVLGLNSDDKYWCTAHPGWVTGSVYGIIAPLSIGCENYVYVPHFGALKWIKFLNENKISVIYTAPTALRLLRNFVKRKDFEKVRNIFSVGEALTTAVYDFYKQLGIEICDTYWQTETGAIVIANWPRLKKKDGSMGKAIPDIKAKIIDGTIHLKPGWPAMMTGIYKHDKMYKSYFEKGWFKTNDLAKKDKDGYFFFEGRKDDIIKTSGERVSPIEVENVLMRHKAVKEVAVIGVADEIKGQIIKAFIVLNHGFNANEKLAEELKFFVKENYAGHSYPKQTEFVSSLPKTNSGKIIRMKLREENKY
ncbi:MAG: AMP-binding protein [Candidatus Pacearchaeota archaeon]